MQDIYLDNASSTPIDKEVLKAMLPFFDEKYGNPETLHKKGKEALIAIDNSRETIAKYLNCKPSEVIFCASGTEANNIAIFGTARANKKNSNHLITSKIEHPSALEPFKKLEKEGFEVTYISPNKAGLIDPEVFKKAIKPQTIFASIIYANNEIGTIQPVKEIGQICAAHNIIFHTDACQAATSQNLNTQELHADLLTINGSKMYGPKGIAALFIKDKIKIEPIFFGGDQEKKLRPGTHNTPNIIGLAKAFEIAQSVKEKHNEKLAKLRNFAIETLLKEIPNSYINGDPKKRLPNNISITIPGITANELLLQLDELGIYIGTGSACKQKSETPSHVLKAIGLSEDHILSTIRITLGRDIKKEEVEFAISKMAQTVQKLRQR